MIITIVSLAGTIFASTGFWSFIQNRLGQKGAMTQLLLGLAHDRIIHLGMGYIERGWIAQGEYDDFMLYLCKPYSKFGGNGLADKVIKDVQMLPIKRYRYSDRVTINEEGDVN